MKQLEFLTLYEVEMTTTGTAATESIALRGYENSSLTPYGSEGYAYTRLGIELRYPLMQYFP